MFCGDRQAIQLTPQLLAKQEFEITYEIFAADNSERLFGKANTRHVCIDPINRTRQPLPSEIIDWLNHWRGTAVEP
jgi:1,4-dihydroxy-2-naphthoyl-CoA hydrolase